MPRRVKKFVCVGVAALAAAAVACHADIDPLSGIDFVTIGDGDNPNYLGAGLNTGHGQVNYEYRMGRTEVPLSLWVEFMNACFDRPVNDRIPHVYTPTQWSPGFATPNTPGGIRWSVPAGREMFPVGGVDWRTCAILTNWLHNNKSLDRSAFLTGAYEVGTFGYFGETDGFTDQITRSPGARYWIPSLDEWMKSAHWDPTKVNTDGTTGGYWLYSNSSDTPFVYGPPGVRVSVGPFQQPIPDPNGQFATSNAVWTSTYFPTLDPFAVPLGAYPDTQSPWGLLDVSGGVGEWTEHTFQLDGDIFPRGRVADGLGWTRGSVNTDRVGVPGGGGPPNFPNFDIGLRIAAVVPSPSTGLFGVAAFLWAHTHRRRRNHAEKPCSNGSRV
jgi:formylglycine-generating enzyme required for sulfatase activity